jgi:hypothetical protein
MLIDITCFACCNKELYHTFHIKGYAVPRVGEYLTYKGKPLEIFRISWLIKDGVACPHIFLDVSPIIYPLLINDEEESNYSLPI